MQVGKRAGGFIGFRFSIEYNHDHLVHGLLPSVTINLSPCGSRASNATCGADCVRGKSRIAVNVLQLANGTSCLPTQHRRRGDARQKAGSDDGT
jgi:hypothetical protein